MELTKKQLDRINLNYYLFDSARVQKTDMFILRFKAIDDSDDITINTNRAEIDRSGNIHITEDSKHSMTNSLNFDKKMDYDVTYINHKLNIDCRPYINEEGETIGFTIGSDATSTFNTYNSIEKIVMDTSISREFIGVDFTVDKIADVVMLINFPYATSAPIVRIYKDLDIQNDDHTDIDPFKLVTNIDRVLKFNDDTCEFNSTLIDHKIKTQEIKIKADMNIKAMNVSSKINFINHYMNTIDIDYKIGDTKDTYKISSKSVNGLSTKSEVNTEGYIIKLYYKDELIDGVNSNEDEIKFFFRLTVNKKDASEKYYTEDECEPITDDIEISKAKSVISKYLDEYFMVDIAAHEFDFFKDSDNRIFGNCEYTNDDTNFIIRCRFTEKYLYIEHRKISSDIDTPREISYILFDLEEASEVFNEYHYIWNNIDNCKYNDSNGYCYNSYKTYGNNLNYRYSSPEVDFDIDFTHEGTPVKINSFNSLIYNYDDPYIIIRDNYGIPNLLFINVDKSVSLPESN